DRPRVPALPVELRVTCFRIDAALVREEQYIVPENDHQIDQFFGGLPEEVWIGPQVEERLLAQGSQKRLGLGQALGFREAHAAYTLLSRARDASSRLSRHSL